MTTGAWPCARPPTPVPPAQQPGPYAPPWHTAPPGQHHGVQTIKVRTTPPWGYRGPWTPPEPPPVHHRPSADCPVSVPWLPCPVLYSWLPDPTLPQRAASERSSDRPPPHPALVWMRGVLSATDPNTDTRGDSYQPPLLICTVGTRHQKFRLCLFFPSKKPGQKYPPRMGPRPKNYHMKNSSGIYATMVAIATRWQTLEGIS